MERAFEATIFDQRLVAEDTYEVTFAFDNVPFNFSAGQYVWVKLPRLLYPDKRGEVRAMSICSSPSVNNKISIVFRKSGSGWKRTLLEMPLGGKVSISGPFGFRTLPEDTTRPLIFVAGGVAIAPFFGMIKWASEEKSKRRIHLVYANLNVERAAYLKELSALQNENPNFNFTAITGPVTEEIIDNAISLPSFKNALWYVSGPKGMVDSTADILYGKGIKEGDIKFEEFHHSAGAHGVKKESAVETEERILLEAGRFKLAVENATEQIIITDVEGVIQFANKATEKMTGYKISEIIGNTPRLWGGLMDKEFYENLWKTKKEKREVFRGEVTNRKKNGETYLARLSVAPVIDKKGELIGFVGNEEDITKEREVENAKTEFVAMASHQLKTPLSAIDWIIEGFLSGKEGKLDAKQKKILSEVYDISKGAGDLISTLLDISKIQLGTFVIKPEKIDLVKICDDILAELEDDIKANKTRIEKKFSSDPLQITADKKFITIIMQNLISNAVKYNRPGGKVIIDISSSDGEILMKFSNEGEPIPKEEQAKIFTKFFRTESAKKKGIEGAGLGLSIVKLLVEKIQGKVWFDSKKEGTTFYVSLLQEPSKTG